MIRELRPTEIEDVMDIWLRTNITAHSFIPEHYWTGNYKVVKEGYIPISTTFVYEENGTIRAFISIIDSKLIGALFVSEAYQGRGIGKKLLGHCKSLYPALELRVYMENENAISFYTRCDFMIKEEQTNEDSGYREYVMTWTE